MIHTAMLTYDLPYSRKNILVFEKFIKQPGSEYHRQYKKWYNQTYRNQGIRVIAYQLDRPGYKGIVFKCRINFKRLIEQEDKVSIYAESDKDQICHMGDYYRRSEALKIIDQSRYHESTKNVLKMILNEVAKQYRSIAKVREQFIEDGMSREQFRLFMKRFDELGINAVTISDNKHLDQKSLKEGLPGVYELFVDALTDSLSVEDSDSLADDLKEAEPDISVELK